MSSLLAIALVAKSSLGPKLVYAFPPDPSPVPRTHKPVYRDARKQSALFSGYASDDESVSSGSSDDDDDENRHGVDSKQYLGFPDAVLASLLSPSRELCDQPFELVVDHLAFVGHPVWLGDEETVREKQASVKGGSSGTEDGDDEGDEDEGGRGRSRIPRYADLSSLVIEDEIEVPNLERDQTIGPPATRNASAPPRPMLIPDPDESTSSPRRPVDLARSQSSASTLHPGSSLASSQHSHNSLAGASRLISFNLVCVIDTPPDSHLSSHLEGFYKDVVVPLTANVKALEKEELWLGKEAAKLRRAREKALEKDENWTEFQLSLPARSALAAAISQLYTALKADELAEIHLGPLPVQVLLRGEIPVEDDSQRDRERDAYFLGGPDDYDETDRQPSNSRSRSISPGGHAYGRHRPAPLFSRMRRRPRVHFEPWETLLLLEDPRQLQRDVVEGSLLSRFLEICRPTLSFAEYETLLDLDQDDQLLGDIVDHLVHWKKARVIDLISLKGSYAVSSSFVPTRLPKLSALFSASFPTLPPLPALLASLTPCEPYSTLIPASQRALYLNALIFLLRHEIVEKQRTYVRIVASDEIKRATAQYWGAHGGASTVSKSHGGSSRYGGAGDENVSGLSTSLSGASDHSFGGRSGRSRQSSKPDLEDARAMAIISNVGSPRESPLSRSAQSATMSFERPKRKTTRSKGISSATFSSHSERPDELSSAPSVIVEPGRPSMLESRWLSEICRDKDPSIVQKFERIVRMLNGRHHLDEIRFRTQLSRRHLQLILTAFDEHLILFTHA